MDKLQRDIATIRLTLSTLKDTGMNFGHVEVGKIDDGYHPDVDPILDFQAAGITIHECDCVSVNTLTGCKLVSGYIVMGTEFMNYFPGEPDDFHEAEISRHLTIRGALEVALKEVFAEVLAGAQAYVDEDAAAREWQAEQDAPQVQLQGCR